MICRKRAPMIALVAALVASASSQDAKGQEAPKAEPFTVTSADGTAINGQIDRPQGLPVGVIVLSAGTGLFDRDARFGSSKTDRDMLFKDLSGRLTAKGFTVLRYDRRGVRYNAAPGERLDKAVSGTSTAETQRDDLGAVYAKARTIGPRCVILFGHSEGMAHIARLAASGAKAPTAVMGMGPLLAGPVETVKWQISGRDVASLKMMDKDGDGRTTNEEVQANWRQTPSGALVTEPTLLLQPDGVWTQEDLDAVTRSQLAAYEMVKMQALALDDAAPYPNGATPMAKSIWWKSWFTDTTPMAALLAQWKVPVIAHLGSYDSQTFPDMQLPSARAALGNLLQVKLHPGAGHSLGEHPLMGPMRPELADAIAADAAGVCR